MDVGTPIGTGIGSVYVVFASSLGAIGHVGTSFIATSLAGTRAFLKTPLSGTQTSYATTGTDYGPGTIIGSGSIGSGTNFQPGRDARRNAGGRVVYGTSASNYDAFSYAFAGYRFR